VPSVPVGATIRDKAAQAIRAVQHRHKAALACSVCEQSADAVLAVVAPPLRAEGAADEREQAKRIVRERKHGYHEARAGATSNDVIAYYAAKEEAAIDILAALVSREAEAAPGGERDG
jgi:hypothetical protein